MNDELNLIPSTPKPNDGKPYFWDEERKQWFLGYEHRPHPSWRLNDKYVWKAPFTKPNNGFEYEWYEEGEYWKKI